MVGAAGLRVAGLARRLRGLVFRVGSLTGGGWGTGTAALAARCCFLKAFSRSIAASTFGVGILLSSLNALFYTHCLTSMGLVMLHTSHPLCGTAGMALLLGIGGYDPCTALPEVQKPRCVILRVKLAHRVPIRQLPRPSVLYRLHYTHYDTNPFYQHTQNAQGLCIRRETLLKDKIMRYAPLGLALN